MKYLDATFATPEENLACDEALLDLCEDGYNDEVLRVWEPAEYFVVLGYSNKVSTEVFEPVCRSKKIPILRRCSGGGTVLQGPGCLNFSLILKIPSSGPLSTLTGTNSFIMHRHKSALQSIVGKEIEVQGHTDLAIGDLKFSGNAQRRKNRCLLFHGTFLLHLDISMAEEVLRLPSKQPAYREGRSHKRFMTNLAIDAEVLKNALRSEWRATKPLARMPIERIRELVEGRYSRREWSHRM
jgi:lipoate-protein ligase A